MGFFFCEKIKLKNKKLDLFIFLYALNLLTFYMKNICYECCKLKLYDDSVYSYEIFLSLIISCPAFNFNELGSKITHKHYKILHFIKKNIIIIIKKMSKRLFAN